MLENKQKREKRRRKKGKNCQKYCSLIACKAKLIDKFRYWNYNLYFTLIYTFKFKKI